MATITIFGETQEEIAAALGAITYTPPPQIKDPRPDLDEIIKERDQLSSENADLRATLNDFVKERDLMVAGLKHVAEKLNKQAANCPLTSAPALVDFARDLMSFIPKEFKEHE